MLAILAEAGLGKSRLISETRALLPANVKWAEGRALSFTAGMSYWLAREIVLSLLNVKPEAAQSEIAAALQKKLEQPVRDLSVPGSIAGAASGRSDRRASEIPFE